jgi:low affinity Fe/Cu permease
MAREKAGRHMSHAKKPHAKKPDAKKPDAKDKRQPTIHERFRAIARKVSGVIGHPGAFVVAVLGVLFWAASGPIFGYSDTWQLVINTTTTIITFLVVFLIQNTQNHDSKAIQLKLDELIRAVKHARTGLVDLEELPDEDLDRLETEFRKLREREAPNALRQAALASRKTRG